MSLADKIEAENVRMLNEIATEATNDLFDAMIADKQNNVLPEHIFTQYFLPYFAGRVPITKKTTVMADWISIAGSPVAEVDIIDGSNNVMFTVPSLFDTRIINPSRSEDEKTLGQIFDLYSLKSNNLPVVASRYLRDALYEKTEDLTEELSIKDTRWDDILTRYDMQPIDVKADSKAKQVEYDDDLIYD